MQVYNEIEEKVADLSEADLENVDLEELISKDMNAYFKNYVEELTQHSLHKELLPEAIWDLTNRLMISQKSVWNTRTTKLRALPLRFIYKVRLNVSKKVT